MGSLQAAGEPSSAGLGPASPPSREAPPREACNPSGSRRSWDGGSADSDRHASTRPSHGGTR
eukprot:762045-Alexandrium_andersonii.AAC.1